MEKTYLISDAAKQVQVETHVLRYWEEELKLPIKRNKQGHRYYTGEDVEFFKEVKKMKDTGLQLKAIRLYMKDGKIIHKEPAGELLEVPCEVVEREEILPVDMTKDEKREKEEKSVRLQMLLKQFIKEAVKDSNQELFSQVRDTILKELDFQFRNQEEREEKREENRIEREEKHFRQLDELLRRKNRRRTKNK